MNQTEKLASANFLIKKAEESGNENQLLPLLKTIANGLGGGIVGGLAGAHGGRKLGGILGKILKEFRSAPKLVRTNKSVGGWPNYKAIKPNRKQMNIFKKLPEAYENKYGERGMILGTGVGLGLGLELGDKN